MRVIVGTLLMTLGVASAATAEWTLAAYLGASQTRDTSITLIQPQTATRATLSPVHYDGASFEAPPYYGYRVAFFPRAKWFGIEGELVHLKVVADTTRPTHAEGTLHGERVSGSRSMSSIIQRFSITHGVNLVLVNAIVRRPLPTRSRESAPRFVLSARVGAGATIPHPESRMDGIAFEAYEWGAFSMQGAAGAECRLRGSVYLLGEYKISRTIQEVTIVDGTARTPLVTHHLLGGLAWHLGTSKGE